MSGYENRKKQLANEIKSHRYYLENPEIPNTVQNTLNDVIGYPIRPIHRVLGEHRKKLNEAMWKLELIEQEEEG
jgi:hypothetical protein